MSGISWFTKGQETLFMLIGFWGNFLITFTVATSSFGVGKKFRASTWQC